MRNRQEIVGAIDFGDMVHAPLVQELAVTIASFTRLGEMSLDNALIQVEAFNAIVPLQDDELEILHDLVLLRLATALFMYDFRLRTCEDPPAYLTEERPDIVHAMRHFLALDRDRCACTLSRRLRTRRASPRALPMPRPCARGVSA